MTISVITITVVASILAAAVIVVITAYLLAMILDLLRSRRAPSPAEQLEAEYRAVRRAMNDAAGQSWRNLID